MKTDELEFTRLIQEHKSTIYMVCYMFSDDKAEVDDLFQEILIKLWKGFGSFRGDSDVKTWVYRVSLNSCINQQASKKRHGEQVPISTKIDVAEEISDKAMQTGQLYARINHLGLVDRGIVLLWLEGLSYEEIGLIVGISVKNVSIRLVRIKEQLKKLSNQ
ncbi:MAG: RNA polymerase sigma factor [Bacteroidales bacterium]|nr:RNA polymerase sigma factor [Bacteroidales bacterium]